MAQLKSVKGMNDILPGEIERWHELESTFRRVAELHGYREARTPLLEQTSLFVRSIGETTDVVEKEMFTFQRSSESLSMRPEGTAGAARAYVTNKVYAKEPISRWYYVGPMFRAERPQKGRYRQFYQAGCEVYGDAGPLVDAELIDMLHGFFVELGVEVTVEINSIGGPGARQRYRDALLEFLRPKQAELSAHAQERLEKNPLRILDSKDPKDQAAVVGAPAIIDVLDDEDRAHWEGLRRALDALGTPYTVAPGLVRGLDYYTRTLFEIKAASGDLGAQNTVCGGGRYDAMVKGLGGPDAPAIGFAMGLERILLAMGDRETPLPPTAFVAPLGADAQVAALELARELRRAGIRTELDGRGTSLKSQLRRANDLEATVALILGKGELEKGVVQLKQLKLKGQDDVPRGEIVTRVRAAFAAASSEGSGA